jgi:ABC-type transport system substrate-binding protein
MKKPLFKVLGSLCLVIVLATTSLLSACGETETVVDVDLDGRIDIGMTSNPNTLVPMKSEKLVQASVAQLIWETLIRLNEDGTVDPLLAESWTTSSNGLDWTFTIDSKAEFSDGNPVTAADVKYTFEVGKRHHGEDLFAQTKAAWAQIDSITVVDASTVKFTLSEAFGTFLGTLGTVFIVPKALWEDIEDVDDTTVLADYVAPTGDAARKALLVGSGPFKFNKYVADQYYWVVRNDDYWNGTAKMKDVVIDIYGTPEIALTALKTGEIDAIQMVETPTQVPLLLSTANVEVDILSDYNHNCFFLMNMRVPPFNELKVRQAVSNAIDREAIINFSQAGFAQMPQNVPYAPGLPWSNAAVAWNDEDLSRDALVTAANALLDSVTGISDMPADPADGWVRTYQPDYTGSTAADMEYECIFISSPGYQQATQIAAMNLADIGIKINPRAVQGSYLGRTLFSGWFVWNWETALFGYPGDAPFDTFVRQWGNEPFGGNYDGSVIGWNSDYNREPGDGLTVRNLDNGNSRPIIFDTPDWHNASDAEKAYYEAMYDGIEAVSLPFQQALQDSRRILDEDDYLAAVKEIQADYEALLPAPVLYHGSFITAYRTDTYEGWGDADAGGPEGVFLYGFVPPTMAAKTLMELTPLK